MERIEWLHAESCAVGLSDLAQYAPDNVEPDTVGLHLHTGCGNGAMVVGTPTQLRRFAAAVERLVNNSAWTALQALVNEEVGVWGRATANERCEKYASLLQRIFVQEPEPVEAKAEARFRVRLHGGGMDWMVLDAVTGANAAISHAVDPAVRLGIPLTFRTQAAAVTEAERLNAEVGS